MLGGGTRARTWAQAHPEADPRLAPTARSGASRRRRIWDPDLGKGFRLIRPRRCIAIAALLAAGVSLAGCTPSYGCSDDATPVGPVVQLDVSAWQASHPSGSLSLCLAGQCRQVGPPGDGEKTTQVDFAGGQAASHEKATAKWTGGHTSATLHFTAERACGSERIWTAKAKISKSGKLSG